MPFCTATVRQLKLQTKYSKILRLWQFQCCSFLYRRNIKVIYIQFYLFIPFLMISRSRNKEDTNENSIHGFSQKPKRYQSNIILPMNQLSQKNHNKINKNDQAYPPSNSSEEQRILEDIQKYTILYNMHLQNVQKLQEDNRFYQLCEKLSLQIQELSLQIFNALMEGNYQLAKNLQNRRIVVKQQLNQQWKFKLHQQKQLHKLTEKLEELEKQLLKQRKSHKINLPRIK